MSLSGSFLAAPIAKISGSGLKRRTLIFVMGEVLQGKRRNSQQSH